jgi:hypothetical protein
MLSDQTISFKGELVKQSKERLTAMMCANRVESDKMTRMVIEKFEHLSCFKNMKTLPTSYTFNKKAWMTSTLMKTGCAYQTNALRKNTARR